MRFVLTSDLHGHLPNLPAGDVLLIAGDICPIENHGVPFQADWLRNVFIPWLRRAPARQKIFIAGNHDFVFAYEPERLHDFQWPGSYLKDSGIEWEGVHFWGTPWANELAGWPFTIPEHELAHYWDMIPVNTQILVVHGPPRGYGDTVIGSLTGDPLPVGSTTLVQAIDRLPKLRLVVYGHIHEGAGVYRRGNVLLVNASLMDVHYEPTNPVRMMDIEF